MRRSRGPTPLPTQPEQTVINISGTELTTEETNILSKGLSFCPTNTVDPFKLKVDTFKFFRALQLKHFFTPRSSVLTHHDVVLRNSTAEDTDPPNREVTPFRKKSSFIPHSNLNPSIIAYSNLVEIDISNICKTVQNKKCNLSHAELKCLNDLEKRKDIIIRSADKGGSVVIMSHDQYDSGIKSQLRY